MENFLHLSNHGFFNDPESATLWLLLLLLVPFLIIVNAKLLSDQSEPEAAGSGMIP